MIISKINSVVRVVILLHGRRIEKQFDSLEDAFEWLSTIW